MWQIIDRPAPSYVISAPDFCRSSGSQPPHNQLPGYQRPRYWLYLKHLPLSAATRQPRNPMSAAEFASISSSAPSHRRIDSYLP
ncbi:hypothetical protein BP00DRAFT_186276 [Aspergillus indologenus CBS 114.80]|uniref:Uncharacterized protein n=1 Tax=Aspergillus indologenus CBS 114.80 TaxID=1450541 RepID=A0A2V5I7D3_9EURO|nr:hypothetical protein BP00DRAFT_186276 [Aspergillus indologenus CBS 114.80]